MNTKLISALVLIGSAAASQVAAAADGQINFNGSVTTQTCTINGNGSGSKNFSVTLPPVSTSSLAAAGQTAGRTAFSISLTGCTPASGNVHTFFEPGTTTDIKTGNLFVATGGAGNVEISLLNSDFSVINAGAADGATGQNSKPVPISTAGAATLNYYAQYYAIGTATAGQATSSVMYTLSYQ